MNLRLVCDDGGRKKPAFVIRIVDGEAFIRRETAPVVDEDLSVMVDEMAISLRVEVVP